MPSWNIHTAHVEKLEREYDLAAVGIKDMNIFLFGNFLPDVYVGYMVPDASMHIDYRLSHMTPGGTIPLPDAGLYWRYYGKARFWAPNELIYGAWAHLVCDHVYNQATREFLEESCIGVDDTIREKKQGDFALFGRTLAIKKRVVKTPELVKLCKHYPQYSVLEADVERAIRVADEIVDKNQAEYIDGSPAYCLLNQEFFLQTFERVHEALVRGFDDMRRNSSEGH